PLRRAHRGRAAAPGAVAAPRRDRRPELRPCRGRPPPRRGRPALRPPRPGRRGDRGRRGAEVHSYRWDGVLPGAEAIQARVAEAVTGVIDLDNLLVVAGHFGALPAEVFVVEVQPVATGFGMEPGPDVALALPEVRGLARAAAQAGPGGPGWGVAGLPVRAG